MLQYRRKLNSGKMILQSRDGGHKSRLASRKILHPGDRMDVKSAEQLPGYPHSMDGWELIGTVPDGEQKSQVPSPKKDYLGVGECLDAAKLEAVRQRGTQWKVIIKEPGRNYTTQDKLMAVLPVGAKVHPGFVSESRAKAWAESGFDPGEEE